MKIYGISNCSTVKRARAFLIEAGVEHTFYDFKKQSPHRDDLQRWVDQIGWEPLVNRQGTTWRKLDAAAQNAIVDAAHAIAQLQQTPSLIRRPVVEWPDGRVSVGFDAAKWTQVLSSSR